MTASDEKDRYGEKLRHVEQAREDQWAAQRDRELLSRLLHHAEERAASDRHLGVAPRVFKRILCPLDFDENSLKALDVAGRVAAQNDAEVYLLHVCPTVFVPLGGAVTDQVMAEQSARRRMDGIAGQNLFSICSHILVTTGDAAERITAVQAALEVD